MVAKKVSVVGAIPMASIVGSSNLWWCMIENVNFVTDIYENEKLQHDSCVKYGN
jgi:hypothetical protein